MTNHIPPGPPVTQAGGPTPAAYEHNGRSVSRAAFYALACDPARSVAVEACAGAGKTWMLVSRMLRALLEGCAPQQILAITFTKKAAGEMRARLQQWLQDFACAAPDALARELQARGMAPGRASEQSPALQNLYAQLLANGRPVQIRTFHGWFAALLGAAPLAWLQAQGLPTQFELLEDDGPAVRAVWRPFLRAVAADPGLRAHYEALVAQHGRWQTRKALEAALARRVEFDLADAAGAVDGALPPFGTIYPDLAGLDDPAQALDRSACRQRWLECAGALARESGKSAPKAAQAIVAALDCASADGDASSNDDDTNTGATGQRLTLLRAALFVASEERLKKNLEKFAAARAAEPWLKHLLAARRQHAAWQHQRRMAALTRCLNAQFAALKHARGWVDMNDVERSAQLLLADPVLSGWLHERLDARIRHLLVDEFQDTNPLQWQALHAWLSGYAGAGGGGAAPSVFIVGDPKQSIYRFRRAEPQLFGAAQAFVRQALAGELLSCDHTRRNARGLIAAVNRVMDAAQVQQEISGFRAHTTESADTGALLCLPAIVADAQQAVALGAGDGDGDGDGDGGADGKGAGRSADPGSASADADGDSGAQLVWRDSLTQARHEAEQTLRMRECTQAAAWVAAQIGAGLPPGEMLVLARKRDRLAAMQDALRALQLPCVQPEKANLFEAPEVQDMVALLDALVSPGHDLSLARALKSPLFGASDAALVQLAVLRRRPENAARSWYDLLQKSELETKSLQAHSADLALYKSWLDSLPPHDALHAIYRHGDVLARFAAAAPAANRAAVQERLRALLWAALEHGGGRYLTPYAFVRAIKRGALRAPGRVDAQAVRLLTVHGAKGLEARCVLLLDADTRAQKPETMGLLVDWPGAQPAPARLVFLTGETSPPPSAQALLATEQQTRQREELNLLYVAMTRAKQCLVLSSVQPASPAPGSWWDRLAPLAQQVEVDGAAASDAAPMLGGGQMGDSGDRAGGGDAAAAATAGGETPAAPGQTRYHETAPSGTAAVVDAAAPGTADGKRIAALPGVAAAVAAATAANVIGVAGAGAADTDQAQPPRPGPGPGPEHEHEHEHGHDHFTLAELPPLPPHLRPAPRPDGAAPGGGHPLARPAPGQDPAISTPESRQGEAMHQLLEQVDLGGAPLAELRAQGWSAQRLALLAQDFDLAPAAARQAAQGAQRILCGAGAWAWDPAAVDQAINEAPLRHRGQNLRIDRLVRCQHPPERAGWWVLDYKSAAAPERQSALLAQLHAYRAAVQAQTPGARVHAAFLTADGRLVPLPEDGGGGHAAPPAPGAKPGRDGAGAQPPVTGATAGPQQASLF